MPPDTTQPTPPEPAQTPKEPQSVPVVDPIATQGPTEAIPASTAVSDTPTMPPVASEAPTPLDTHVSAEMPASAIPAPEPQNPTPAPTPAPANVVEERSLANPPMADSGRPEDSPQRQNPRSFLAKALEKIQFRKRAKFEKIMKFAQGRKEITNDQVEKLLHVSDSTAQRYLIQLAKEGKLKRIGKDGSSRYEPLNGSNGGN